MNKVVITVIAVSLAVLVITETVMGVKIFSGNYDIIAEAYAAEISLAVFIVANLVRNFLKSRCPHCGKFILVRGKYCYKCGKEL